MEKQIKVLIVDDHEIVREGIRDFIEIEPGFEIVGTAENGDQAVRKANILHPDIILMDLVMPVMSGVEAIRKIKGGNPDIKILVITSYYDDEKVFPALTAGASGYLLKDTSPQQLTQAIRAVIRGESPLHPVVASKVLNEHKKIHAHSSFEHKLTRREFEVLKLIAQGFSNIEVAERLYLSENTVRAYVSKLLEKFDLANRTQLSLFALQEGLVNLDINP